MDEGMWSVTDRQRRAAELVDERWGALLDEISAEAAARDAARAPIPAEFFRRAGATGLQALPLPPEVGGSMDTADWVAVLEHIGYRCRDNGFPLVLNIRTSLARILFDPDRPDLIDDYVAPIAHGDLTIAIGYTENSDVLSFRTTLTKTGDGFVLDGRKDFMTGGANADVFLVYARTDTGDLVGCLVHRDDPGVTVVPVEPLGTRTCAPAAIELRGVPLAVSRVVSGKDGLSHAQRFLNDRRLMVCCAPVGQARALVEMTAARLGSTIRGGRSLDSLSNVQATLGRMYIAVEAARAMLYRAAEQPATEIDAAFNPVISAAKHFIVQQVRFVAEQAMRVLGGHFYYGEPYFGICLHDFAGLVTVAGTQDLLEINLGALASAYLTHPRKE